MPYNSIDEIQSFIADSFFKKNKDPKKSAGRVLGTFVEIITYYLLKSFGFHKNMAIDTRLPEFDCRALTHKTELTLHRLRLLKSMAVDRNASFSSDDALKEFKFKPDDLLNDWMNNWMYDRDFVLSPSEKIIDAPHGSSCIKNGVTIGRSSRYMYAVSVDSSEDTCTCSKLECVPFAAFKCRRSGGRGSKTFKQVKQGIYVMRTFSALRRVKTSGGAMKGFVLCAFGKYILDDYFKLMERILIGDLRGLYGFTLTVGVVSNYGNWFTSDNPDDDIKALQHEYDWLLSISDDGLAKFAGHILSDAMPACRAAFTSSCSVNSATRRKNINTFTKSFIDYDADVELTKYFTDNADEILSWFNVMFPAGGSIDMLKIILRSLAAD